MTKVSITVQASAAHPDVLDVRDAMQQVLDFFDLLSAEEGKPSYVWNLTFAGTNSPFRAEAEAVSLDPVVNVAPIVRTRVLEASEFLEDVSQGKRPRRALGKRRTEAARKLLRRNTNGVGITTAQFGISRQSPLTVTPTIAQRALAVFDADEGLSFDLFPSKRKRAEIGSIEGTLIDVGTDYSHPAVHVREHKSGVTITCRIEQSHMEEIAQATSFQDVWERRRVIVRGKIQYNADGDITRVHARTIKRVMPREMTLRDIEDTDFTDGLETSDYLERLREGELG